MSDKEKAFEQWLKGKNAGELDPDLTDDEQWLARMQTAQYITHQAEVYPEQEVPQWDREATFASEKKSWWQWGGLPALSMAFSCCAMVLVIFKVEISMQDGGMLVSFAGSNDAAAQQQLSDLVDQKLQTFASEQQVILANYTADLKVQQQDSNLQLASYILSTSRQERKEDMTDFINYINDKRKDDKLDQRIQFEEFKQTIQYQNANYQRGGYSIDPTDKSSMTAAEQDNLVEE